MESIQTIFDNYDGPLLHKWDNYPEIYDNYFSKYRGTDVVFLEIGISHGGSLKFWREYFGDKARIYAVDVNPKCKQFEAERTKIFIGSQEDPVFLEELKRQIPPLDILLDDGGHTMKQQIVTFNLMFDHVKENGVYMCEDVHTSYMRDYGGRLKGKTTFIEFCKNHIDDLYACFMPAKEKKKHATKITTEVWGIHFYNSIVVYLKKKMKEPVSVSKGFKTVDTENYADYGKERPFYKDFTDFIFRRKRKK
ncbi:MAG: class I SAM-dependent methyltransferase [Niabella sp.]